MSETPATLEFGTVVPTALYRLFAESGALLYVGVTDDLRARMSSHASQKGWWNQVTRTTVTWYPTRQEALKAESAAIRAEAPQHNVQGATREIQSREIQGTAREVRRPTIRLPRELPPHLPLCAAVSSGYSLAADSLREYALETYKIAPDRLAELAELAGRRLAELDRVADRFGELSDQLGEVVEGAA